MSVVGCYRPDGCRSHTWLITGKPDSKNVCGVTEVSTEQLQPAVSIVAPNDGNLFDAITKADRKRQNLDIEHISVDALKLEQTQRNVSGKEFEAALGIADAGQTYDGLHEVVETLG